MLLTKSGSAAPPLKRTVQDEDKYGKTSFLANAGRYRAENLVKVADDAPDWQHVQCFTATLTDHQQ